MKEIKNALVMAMEPQEPFFEWVEGLIHYLKELPFSESRTFPQIDDVKPTMVFIHDVDTSEKLTHYLFLHSEELLAHEFSKWTKEESLWPNRCDLEYLQELFNLKFYSNIIDLRNLK